MFNRIIFFWKIGCIGAVLGIANWLMLRQGLPVLQPWPTLVLFLILPFFFSLAYNAIHAVPVWLAKGFAWIGGSWFIITLYATLFTLLYSVLWALCLLSGSQAFWQAHAAQLSQLFAAAVLAIFIYGIWRALHPVIRKIAIEAPQTASQLTIAFLTDLHTGPLQSHWYVKKMVQRLNALAPDVIFFGGDLIDAHLPFVLRDGSYRHWQDLKAPYGIWAVFGNHDFYDGNIDEEARAFSMIHFLRRQSCEIVPGIVLTGLNDYIHFPSESIPDCQPGAFNILMDHEPLRIEAAAKKGYDLYLGGHTHGGQFFPVTTITNHLYLLNYGSRRLGKLLAVVSSGYGSWGMTFRTSPPPEIVIITINGAKANG